jgi:CBS domain-containing protein
MEELVRDVMTRAFVRMDADASVEQVLRTMRDAGAEFALLDNAQGVTEALADFAVLRRAASHEPLAILRAQLPRPLVVPSSAPLDVLLGILSKDFVLKPDLVGVIVADDDEPEGVVARETVSDAAARQRVRGPSDRLPGTPTVRPPVYECKTDGYRRAYVPAPPTTPNCPNGHPMQKV